MSGSSPFGNQVEDLVRLALGDPEGAATAVRARADQVLARLGDAIRTASPRRERIAAMTETFMHGALVRVADAARGDRIELAEAEMTASSVAAAMDRAAEADRDGDDDTVAAAMAAAESLLQMDLAGLYALLL